MTAIEASSVRCKTLADGSLDVTLRIEPRDAVAAFTLLSAPGTPVALAAIKTAAQKQQAERAKGGEAARWLGIRCGEQEFHWWLSTTFHQEWLASRKRLGVNEPLRAISADVVRRLCEVSSRADIDNDKFAAVRFDTLIRKPWQQYQESKQ